MNCPGKRNGHVCAGTIWKCKKCGAIGCEQFQIGSCTNQGFRVGKCLKCGHSAGKESFR